MIQTAIKNDIYVCTKDYCVIFTYYYLAINSSLLNSKVIGGHEASLKSKKFMASLRVRESHFCCGFLLTRRIVITTGSCANFYKLHGGINFNDSTVYFGIVNIDSPRGKKIKVEHANYHPEYNPEDPIKTSGFDIGYVLVSLFISFGF